MASALLFGMCEQLFRVSTALYGRKDVDASYIFDPQRAIAIGFHVLNARLACHLHRDWGWKGALVTCILLHLLYNLTIPLSDASFRALIAGLIVP